MDAGKPWRGTKPRQVERQRNAIDVAKCAVQPLRPPNGASVARRRLRTHTFFLPCIMRAVNKMRVNWMASARITAENTNSLFRKYTDAPRPQKNPICTVYGRPRREKQESGMWGPLKLPIGETSPLRCHASLEDQMSPTVDTRRHLYCCSVYCGSRTKLIPTGR